MANNSSKDLLKKYRSSINENILEQFTQVKEINDKYQLSSGTEDDFNNAAKFLFYAQTKNTNKITQNENDFSIKFGKYLTKYYNSYLNNDDIAILANYIHYYNKQIDSKYNIDKTANDINTEKVSRIMTDIYGIDSQTFAIKSNSYAYTLLERIKTNYVKYMDKIKLEELNTLVLNYLLANAVDNNSYTAEKLRLNSMYENLVSLYITKYKTKYGLYPSYKIGSGEWANKYYILTANTLEIYDHDTDGDITNKKLAYYKWNVANMNDEDKIDGEYYKKVGEEFVKQTSFGVDYVRQVIDTLLTSTYTGGKYTAVAKNDYVSGVTDIVSYYLNQIFNETTQTYNYSYDSYEQEFLIMVTYDYILNKISDNGLTVSKKEDYYNFSTSGGYLRADYITNKITSENLDLNNILYTDIASGAYVSAKNYNIKLQITSDILTATKNINIGNLNDPYYIDQNIDEASMKNQLIYYDVDGLQITGQVDGRSVSEITNLIFDSSHRKYFTNTRTGYYTLDINYIYHKCPSIYKIKFANSNIFIFDRSSSNITNYIYENDITNLYYNYFRPVSNEEANIIFANENILEQNRVTHIVPNNDTYVINPYLYMDGDTEVNHKSYLEYILTKDVDSDGSFDAELKIMKNTFKIFFEFEKPTTLITETSTISELELYEKRNSDSFETYNALQYVNLNYLTLSNIIIEKGSKEYKLLQQLFDDKYSSTKYKDYGFTSTTNSQYCAISLNIIYKELNPEIREIDCSDIQNRILGEYISIMGDNTVVSSDLYDIVQNDTYMTDIDEENTNLFLSLHTNDYVIRNSVSDDLIAYLSGDCINFGNTLATKTDIEEIKRIYKEVRDFFYTVLLNKAFTVEDLYDVYKQIYIKAYTIERFMSSRIENLKSIDLYTSSDCRNFLISYGLKILSDQVDNYNFTNSLIYKRRLIANYNDLMSQKGSKSVMDQFFEIFDYDTTEIEVYKYLLLKLNTLDNTTSKITASDINFIPIPYTTTNLSAAIDSSKNKAKAYDDFIVKDKYWSKDDLSEDEVASIMENPVNTKYLGVDLKKDIYLSYIKSKYILSLNDYLYESLFYKDGEDKIKYYDTLLTQTGLFGSNVEIGVISLYKLTKLLFAQYIYIGEQLADYCTNNDQSVDISNQNLKSTTNKTFYGINKKTFIADANNFDFYNTTFLNKATLTSLFKCPYVKYDTTGNSYKMSTDDTSVDYIDFYANTLNFKPYSFQPKVTVGGSQYSNAITNILFGQNNTGIISSYGGVLPYIIPLSTNITGNEYIFKTTVFDNFQHNLNEIVTDAAVYNKESTSAFSTVNDALNSIAFVNFINKNYYDNIDKNITVNNSYYSKLKAIYFFNKEKVNTAYPLTIDKLGTIDSDLTLSNTNFYDNIFNATLDFPIKYLNGEYGNHNGNNYFHDVRTITDELFNKYFTITGASNSDVHDPIGYMTGNATSDAAYYLNNLDSFYNSDGSWNSTLTSKANVESLFCGRISIGNTRSEGITINNITFNADLFTKLSNKLIECCTAVNEAVTLFNNMQLEFQFTENITNLFDFIKTCIEFFISYTSTIYESNLIYKIDTKNERVPITYMINDKIENQATDYLYYDESCSIEEFDEALQ